MNVVAKVSFSIEPLLEARMPTDSVVPAINGAALTDLIAAYENERDYNPAGGYAGIVPQYFRSGDLDRYFMTEFEADSYWVERGGIYLLSATAETLAVGPCCVESVQTGIA